MDENPRKTREEHLMLFREHYWETGGEAVPNLEPEFVEYTNSMLDYWFGNAYLGLVAENRSTRTNGNGGEAPTVDAKKEAALALIRSKLRLSMRTLNGKALGDCTGRECELMGGVFAKIAARVKPNEKVGKTLTNKQLKELV